ncbi:hypothetical protein OIU78_013308 [Salix suchowensis]|nr:hypothetical protein OIU78_013308 [Salix suchowensis]
MVLSGEGKEAYNEWIEIRTCQIQSLDARQGSWFSISLGMTKGLSAFPFVLATLPNRAAADADKASSWLYIEYNESASKMENRQSLSYGGQEQVEKTAEEVASSDGTNKTQIGGERKKSSLEDTASSVKVERLD